MRKRTAIDEDVAGGEAAPVRSATMRSRAQKRKAGKVKVKQRGVHYVMQIDNWDWSFSYGVNRISYFTDLYADYRHLNVSGKLLRPKKVAGDTIQITFVMNRSAEKLDLTQANPEVRKHLDAFGIGALHSRKGKSESVLPMPADALQPNLAMFIAGKMRFVVLDGSEISRGQAKVHGYSIDEVFDEEGFPAED